MITRMYGGALLALIATVGIASAQDKPMPTSKMMDKTLTGCVMRSDNGVVTLAHAMTADKMSKAAMKKDDGKKEMATEAAPELSSRAVDLAMHVGHQVSIAGTSDMMNGKTMFTVKSLKVLASNCS